MKTSYRYEIVRRGDGKFFVRTNSDETGPSPMIGCDYAYSLAEAFVMLSKIKAQRKAAELANRQDVVHTEAIDL